MTLLPQAIAAAEGLALIAVAISWWGRARRNHDAILREFRSGDPDPGQVEALVDRLDAVSRNSEHGGTLSELATAALTWMSQQQGARP